MIGIVDRLEEKFIVIEIEEKIYTVGKNIIQGEITEGDVVDVIFENDKIISIKKNNDKTISRKQYIADLTKDMWE